MFCLLKCAHDIIKCEHTGHCHIKKLSNAQLYAKESVQLKVIIQWQNSTSLSWLDHLIASLCEHAFNKHPQGRQCIWIMHSANLLMDQYWYEMNCAFLRVVRSGLHRLKMRGWQQPLHTSIISSVNLARNGQQLLCSAHMLCEWGVTFQAAQVRQAQTCEHVSWWNAKGTEYVVFMLKRVSFLCRCCWPVHSGHCSSGIHWRDNSLANCNCSRTHLERHHLLSTQRSQLPFIKFQFLNTETFT